MKAKKTLITLFSLMLISCGGESEIPNTAVLSPVTNTPDPQITELINKIDSMDSKITRLEQLYSSLSSSTIVRSSSSGSSNTTKSSASVSSSTTKKTENENTVEEATKEETTQTKTDTASKANAYLAKMVSTMTSSAGYEMNYDKYEKNPDTGKVRDTGTRLVMKNPGTVFFEITRNPDDPGKEGTKIKYNVTDSQAKARSTGIASITTVTLDMTDERIVSPNGYKLPEADIPSLLKRMGSGSYEAELTGKTSVGGTDVYILKVTTDNNTMDSKITYENIGFDPKTFTLRLWEAYSNKESSPFIRVSVSSINILSSVPEDKQKL